MLIKTLRPFQEEAIASGVALFSAAQKLLAAAGADADGRRIAINLRTAVGGEVLREDVEVAGGCVHPDAHLAVRGADGATACGPTDSARRPDSTAVFRFNHNGYLLIEAPTGCGKTLMAGSIVEKFSAEENVVWFWFAPFKGVVGQTENFLREQFQGLRLRDLATDRTNDGTRAGDTFVTTWQTVATRLADRRNVRKESETNPSIDTLVENLRERGLRIGVVVDEAHHGFGRDTQAAKFFQEILRPEYTILITATPDDADVKEFERAMGIAELQRIRVSRADAVSAGLIKTGVKCAAYCVTDPARAALVDLQATALRDGVAVHRQLKAQLAKINVPLTPLLLVQAKDSRNIEKIKERLLLHGFTEEQIAVHTADEPDDNLLAIANDDRREVLIFKMAVALGFDAPRAFTLVSMRAGRDPDFGVQLIGRILRVHRLLQGRAQSGKLPAELNHGYVFLSDLEAQDGLDKAGQRINTIQTEYAKASAATVVLRVDDGAGFVATVDKGGQYNFVLEGGKMPPSGGAASASSATGAQATSAAGETPSLDLGTFFSGTDTCPDADASGASSGANTRPVAVAGRFEKYRYKLRADAPRVFKTQTVCMNNEISEEDCARQFIFSAQDLFNAMKNKIPVEKRTLEVFTQAIQSEFNFFADRSPEHTARLANEVLCKNQTIDVRELRFALLRKLTALMREEAMEEAAKPEKVVAFLNIILAAEPKKLWDAQKAAIAKNAQISDTDPLPEELLSDEPLPTSARNIYGVYPAGLNAWEKSFAELLDSDPTDTVLWWHRNEVRTDSSVNVLMPDGRGFYPDFIIGVRGRPTEDNVLLADTKLNFAAESEAPKVLANHKTYGRVMILFRDPAARWFTVNWNERRNTAEPQSPFHLTAMPRF
jgi:superfamily II DNA or RNA helicase